MKLVKFNCSEGSVCLFDEDADEIIWSMNLEYSDEVEEKLHELLTLVTGEKELSEITFPYNNKETKPWKPNDWRTQ